MKKIKLIHVISNLERGGAQAVLYDVLVNLDNRYFEHHVIYFRYGPYVETIKKFGIPIYHVNGFFCLYDPIFFVRFLQLIKQLAPDCIHSLLWAANMVSRCVAYFLNIPLVQAIHNNVEQDGYIRYIIDYLSLSLSEICVVVSAGVRASFLQRYPWFDKQNIKVIQNGINIDGLCSYVADYSFLKYKLGIKHDAFIIGSVGRFELIKNYTLLLKSFSVVVRHIENVHLLLVGSGSQELMLRSYAQRLGIAHKITFITGESSYGYLPLFDCFALSSDKEGISIALLEAMALGITCIVTSADRYHPVIQSRRNGLLVPAGDFQLLTESLLKIITDTQLRQRLGKNGYQTIKNEFDHRYMIQAYSSLFLKYIHHEQR